MGGLVVQNIDRVAEEIIDGFAVMWRGIHCS